MTTVLDKQVKRQIVVDGVDYTVAIDPEGLRLIGKGKRIPEVELRWRDLLSGEAALAVALNASIGKRKPPAEAVSEPAPVRPAKRAAKKRTG